MTIGGADILLGGDVITKIDGKPVRSMDDVIRVVDSKKPGDEVTLKLLRGKDERTVKVTLGDRPASSDRAPAAAAAVPEHRPSQRPGSPVPAPRPAVRRSTIGGMAAKVKICGVTRREDAELAVGERRLGDRDDLRRESPRCCDVETAAEIATALQAPVRGRRRVRERAARRRAGDARQRAAHDAPAPRRRGPVLLRRGRAAAPA